MPSTGEAVEQRCSCILPVERTFARALGPLSETLKVCTAPRAAMLLPCSFLAYIRSRALMLKRRFPLVVAEFIQ